MALLKLDTRLSLDGRFFRALATPQLSRNIDNSHCSKANSESRKTCQNSVFSFWLTGASYLRKSRPRRATKTSALRC
jgi:hypothetical protein